MVPVETPCTKLSAASCSGAESLTSDENCAIFFFFAFMMFGRVAYRGWLSRKSVVTTAGSRRDTVSRPPSICAMHYKHMTKAAAHPAVTHTASSSSRRCLKQGTL